MAPLNIFQRVMRAWDEVLPYNAVHVIDVESPFEEERLRVALREALGKCGFPREAGEIPLEIFEGGAAAGDGLRGIVEGELNRRFEAGARALPFRFFADARGADGFTLGVCYHHYVASADCVCWLLEDIVASFCGVAEEMGFRWSGKTPPRYRALLPRNWFRLPGWAWTLPASLRRGRRFARLPRKHREGARVRTEMLSLSAGQREWIRRQARESNATSHEVVLSLVLCAVSDLLPHRFQEKRRRDVAVGSIVNARRHFGEETARTFGLFLALFAVSHPVPEGSGFAEVLDSVRGQALQIKKRRLYLRNLIQLGLASAWGKLLAAERRPQLYAKHFPLAASVTDFFVDRFQNHLNDLPVVGYRRAVSASPATPLVVSFTTFRGEAKLSFSFDDSVYSEDEVKGFVARFLDQLEMSER